MRIIKANAEYTGGGIYRYTALLESGDYLLGNSEWEELYVVDKNPDEDDESWYNEWIDNHLKSIITEEEYKRTLQQLLTWIIKNEPQGNYSVTEIESILESELGGESDTNVELYYAMINILDWYGKKERYLTMEDEANLFDVVLGMLGEIGDLKPEDVGDANDCGVCSSWKEVGKQFRELWKNEERS